MFDARLTVTDMIKQRMLRKNVHLTDFQIRRLQELSEFDGLDPVEHAKRAIDEYLKRQKLDFIPPQEEDIQAEFRERSENPGIQGAFWVSGIVDKYEFSALILNSLSKSGIDKGRISKLSIWDPAVRKKTNNFIGSCIINYDRGWDIRPSRIAEPYYNKVKSLIDNSADQFIRKMGKIK
jgi:hypothetical protein